VQLINYVGVVEDVRDCGDAATRFRIEVLRLSRRIRHDRALSAVGDAQLSVAAFVYDHGETTPGRLAEEEDVTPPAMNHTVNSLERIGYARRVPDPEDRRRVLVELTEAGRAFVAETRRQRDARMAAEFRSLAAEDRAVMERATELMKALLK